jgi:hypothetical protein
MHRKAEVYGWEDIRDLTEVTIAVLLPYEPTPRNGDRLNPNEYHIGLMPSRFRVLLLGGVPRLGSGLA